MSAQVLLLERHGTAAIQEEAGPHSIHQLKVMATALLAAVKGCMPQRIHEWFVTWAPDSPPSERLTVTLAAIDYISSVVWPKEDLLGWEFDADYSCLLNVLYVALLSSFSQGTLPRKCLLPGCTQVARARSEWCTTAHGDAHRKRRERAKREWHLRDGEVAKVESLVRSEGLSHDEAAKTVVARQKSRH
jgi:hypothetical protein